jgi:hypothetical protein
MPPRRKSRALQLVAKPVTVDRARELLGAEADGMTDGEVLELSEQAEAFAHIIVQLFQERRS